MPIPSILGTPRQLAFASISFALGLWAFYEVNTVSGPAFEPILAVCTDNSIAVEDFSAKTGYHAYDARVGMVVFKPLVCLITQFLLELRNTPPDGAIVWFGVLVSALPFSVAAVVEAGRGGVRGLVNYPIIGGLLYQLFGISVMMPLVWLPFYIYGGGKGPVSVTRALASIPMSLPGIILSTITFYTDTDSSLWTTCAGILGGPGLPLFGAFLWGVKIPSDTKENIAEGCKAAAKAYLAMVPVGLLLWGFFLKTFATHYGLSIFTLWDRIWLSANSSVAFMTVDTIVLWMGVCLYIAYRDMNAAVKAIALTPLVGPGASCCYILAEIETSTAKEALKSLKSE